MLQVTGIRHGEGSLAVAEGMVRECDLKALFSWAAEEDLGGNPHRL